MEGKMIVHTKDKGSVELLEAEAIVIREALKLMKDHAFKNAREVWTTNPDLASLWRAYYRTADRLLETKFQDQQPST
jgi:hypothetical protein